MARVMDLFRNLMVIFYFLCGRRRFHLLTCISCFYDFLFAIVIQTKTNEI